MHAVQPASGARTSRNTCRPTSMRPVAAACATFLALFAATPAQAAPEWQAQLDAYVQSPGYNRLVTEMVARNELALSSSCISSKVKERTEMKIIAAPVFQPDQEAPVTARWKDQVKVDRCGETVYHNFLYDAQHGKQPELVVLMPGTTQANPVLQRDVLTQAGKVALDLAQKNCFGFEQPRIANTRFEKEIKPFGKNAEGNVTSGEWLEIWTYRVCGKPEQFEIQFQILPNGKVAFQTTHKP